MRASPDSTDPNYRSANSPPAGSPPDRRRKLAQFSRSGRLNGNLEMFHFWQRRTQGSGSDPVRPFRVAAARKPIAVLARGVVRRGATDADGLALPGCPSA